MNQHPWFTAAIIGTLALGIGVNTTVFTLVNAVLFKPLPFPGGDRIVMVHATLPTEPNGNMSVSYPDLQDFRQAATSFERLEAYYGFAANLTESGNPPERYRGARITSGLFELLRVQPVLGRALTASDEKAGAESVILLGYGVWKDRYGRDPNIIGRTVRVNDTPAAIVGVMPEGFKFPQNEDIWRNVTTEEQLEKRNNRSFLIVGKLKPGQTIGGAQSELAIVATRLQQQFPDSHKNYGVAVRTFHEVMNGGPIRLVFLLLMGAVAFVLLIACANVANMLLGRALARRREISIRVAMGASRGRILRQLLVESVLLAFIGGAVGLLLSQSAVDAFSKAVENVGKPYWIQFEMDYTVFAYFAGVSLVSGILFGLVPALQATRIDLNDALKEGSKASGGRRSGYFSGALVVFQFTLAVVLLTAAGLMIRSFLNAQQEFANVRGEKVLHARINLPASRYATPESRRQFYENLLSRAAAIPGANEVATVSNIPGSGTGLDRFEIEGQPIPEHENRPVAGVITSSPGYYSLLGMALIQGRDFTASEGLPGKEAIIISREFATKFFSQVNPIGRKIRFFDDQRAPKPWMTIVAIAPDIRMSDPGRAQRGPVAAIPYNATSQNGMALMMRTAGDSTALTSALRREVQQLDGELPLFDVNTLEGKMQRNYWHLRVFGTLFLAFAVIAMGMAAVGIYAVIAHATGQRTREIGVRLALGAGPASIIGLVLQRGLAQIGIGMTLGLTAAYFLCRLMATLLLKVSPSDPFTFGIVGVTLSLAGLAACLIPARRASRLDPLEALRQE
ncbi:MAG: ABC transporter permease [Bryobacterales bacterium]|nr:ABC transporter permease [Bryobacterales bacterium]